jgi:hypothetical protein
MDPDNMAVTTVGHTEEARDLAAAGEVRLGDKALDVPISSMTDREIIEETLVHARNTRDTVNAFVEGLMASPLGPLMTGGKVAGPLGLLFGNGG